MKVTLKAARVNTQMTQKNAAEAIGVTEDTISNWERSKSFPDAMQIKKIERAYHVAYNDIIFLPKINA